MIPYRKKIWPWARLFLRGLGQAEQEPGTPRMPGLFTRGGETFGEEELALPAENRVPLPGEVVGQRRRTLAGAGALRTPGIFREGGIAYGEEQMGLPAEQRRPLTLMEQSQREAEWKAQAEIAALQKPKPQQRKKPEGLLTGLRPFSGNYPTNRRSFSAEF